MNPRRRAWLLQLARRAAAGAVPGGWAASGQAARVEAAHGIRRGRVLRFPQDHGAHPGSRTEWWYVTGWLASASSPSPAPTHGFQVTFFRSRVGAAGAVAATSFPSTPSTAPNPSSPAAATAAQGSPAQPAMPSASTASTASAVARFEPRHLLFAHAALTDLATGRHLHAQRIARWNGEPSTGPDRAALVDADIRLGRWQLTRDAASPWQASRWQARVRAEDFALAGTLQAAQPPLLQGDAGFSRKGPEEAQASHYYSLPQLDARLTLEQGGREFALAGRAWLDHEWSDELLHPQAVGWDWIGINLLDGAALTAFRLRRADGSTLWAGGSVRAATDVAAGASTRIFEPHEVRFEPGRRWRSAATNALYPVTWQVHSPAGRHTVRALLDAQELDSRASTGAVYWEGLAELLDDQGRRIGLGYLEMTGYAAPIRLG